MFLLTKLFQQQQQRKQQEGNVIGPIISAGISRTNVSRRAARFRIH